MRYYAIIMLSLIATACMHLPDRGQILRDYRKDYAHSTQSVARMPGFEDQYPVPKMRAAASPTPVSLQPPRLGRITS